MVVISKYLCGVKSNSVFKYIQRGYVSVLNNHYKKFQDCGGARKTKGLDCLNLEDSVESGIACNGMRLVCDYNSSFTATIGCFVPAGSMYETCEERGSALFLEHLLFRRTEHKDQEQLEIALEEIGANVAAIATRDIFLFYGTVPCYRVDKLIQFFAEVILCGVICDNDVKREKGIILHELNKMESNKELVVMDYLPTIAYQDTALENSIFPETDVIKNFCTDKLIDFRNRLFKPSLMTMICVGSVYLHELEKCVEKYFADGIRPESFADKISPCTESLEYRFSGADLRLRDDDEELGYVALGIEGPGHKEPEDYFALNVAKEFVGAWDRSYSGINHNAPYLAHIAYNTDLCEKYKSFFHEWSQSTSIWGCYFVSYKLNLEYMIKLLYRDWVRLCTTITQKEVSRAVNQCITKELMILNDPLCRFLDIAKNLFRYGRYCPIQQRILAYEKITASKIRDVSLKYIYDQSPAIVAIGRIENLPDYNRIRSGTYSLRY
ncbi:mitochondrial-processing peptidase subunit beta [Calliopsis andreniformis]|uniref:mitochondrial-processing peptidase subunit beta n=1 Tax=Calliopsis andreniformis TaxID=337506 RepID=UPI003FCE7832